MPHRTPDLRQWHRLFGIALTDLFTGTPYQVELEKELALKSQVLDVAIIRRADRPASGRGDMPLPDGLDGLQAHNLLTFKSQHEGVTGWALDELVGHYVNYRKQLGPKDQLLPEPDFGLYAAAVRFPRDLAAQVSFRPAGLPGVFDIPWGIRHIRLVVLGEIEAHPRNAAWELFSARADRIARGARYYRARDEAAVTLLRSLYLAYELELSDMPYTMEQFIREAHQDFLRRLTPDERKAFLDQIPPEERLSGLNPEERLRGLEPEERLRGLDPEERLRGLEPEERLRGLDPEDRLRGLDPEDRLRGLDPEDRLRGLSAEELRALKDALDRLN